MAYENITLRKRNVTMIDGYFYMIDEDQDALIVKTDDGTQAYSYPLSDTLSSSEAIVSLEYDGRNFWSLSNPGGGTIVIRRWYINNFVLTLRDTFTKSTDATDTWSANAFTVEHYHVKFSGVTSAGTTTINVSTDGKFDLNDTGKMVAGTTRVTFGPNADGEVEEHIAVNVTANSVQISAPGLANDYDTNDPISFYTAIWVFNNYDGLDSGSGALYKLNPYSPSAATLNKTAGGAYQNVQSATFYDMYDVFYDATDPTTDFNAIAYIKATNMIFLDPADLTNSFGSMTMDNLEEDQATTITIYDVTIEGSNVYRLQRKATYYGSTYTFNDDTYNYQLSTLESFITSISLRAEPAILPANGVNTSEITAIVRDQFNLPIQSKPVYFTHDDPAGHITISPVSTNANGEAVTSYQAGTTAREVKITATAQQS